MRSIISFISLIFMGLTVNAQDIIITNNKEEIEVEVIEITDDAIKYKRINQLNGPIRTITQNEIFMILYEDGTREVFKNKNVEQPVKEVLNIPEQNRQTQPINENKILIAPEDKSVVYIVRPSTIGFAIKFKVYCDGEYIGYTKAKDYLYVIIEPGNHLFLSKAENSSELRLFAEPNEIYFIQQKVKMGAIKSRNELILLNSNEGREALKNCELSKN